VSRCDVALGIYGLENLFGGDFTKVIDVVAQADAVGIDQMVMTDHVVMGTRTDRYPYGRFPSPPETPWYEPIVALSAFAAATSNIRLSTSVLISPLRSAVLLAKQAATLDVISGGRLDLGVGTGWQREEYEASGLPFEGRGQRMEDQLRACQVLWREAPASFRSESVSFDDIYCRPAPAQEGGIPLWFGMAPSPRNARRIAELGVGWLPITSEPEVVAEGAAKLREAFGAAGRDPSELKIRAGLPLCMGDDQRPSLDATLAGFDSMLDAGVTHVEVLPFMFCRKPEDIGPCLERIAKLKG
jgi:probable F420-dependent oxidoreductase